MAKGLPNPKLLRGVRVYLSGPMDFVASRAEEQKHGWRNRVGDFLRELGVTVFDPWFKPEVRGLHDYGREGVDTTGTRELWTFTQSGEGAEARSRCSGHFWETQHIDLRMVDTSDFTIAYCPTNIYSVGTPHEIITCRQQRKPVLFVSPPVAFVALQKLKQHLAGDQIATKLLEDLAAEVPIKENPRGIPSLWYMPLVGGERFFDGFGFKNYIKDFGWERIPMDDYEDSYKLENPLLPFLEKLNEKLPQKWDNQLKKFVRDDNWLLWDLEPTQTGGAKLRDVRG
jgi:hypothetical protein